MISCLWKADCLSLQAATKAQKSYLIVFFCFFIVFYFVIPSFIRTFAPEIDALIVKWI